jgi:hypothetical protein
MIQILTYWKMAWLRATLYACIVGGSTAQALSETWSDATWNNMGFFLKARFFVAVGLAAGGAVLAFIDQTMGQLRNGQAVAPVVPAPEEKKP